MENKKTLPNAHETSIEYGKWQANPKPDEEIVITGLSGRFPESNNIYEFRDNLFNKIDMLTDDSRRWLTNHPEIPQRTGKISDLDKFDAGFFGIHYRQAHSMDPMLRVLLEKIVETIMDAGLHPSELAGTNTGVFLGSCFSETEKQFFYEEFKPQQFGITGCIRSMLANRVSYYLKLKGPSYIVDTACSSSLYALEHAYKAIRNGECDKAFVGGTQICLHPVASLQFFRLGVLSTDGSCKVFDHDANGYARAEAIACILLEKSRDARRIYAQVLHAKINCDGFKEQGITFPSSDNQKFLLKEFYKECTVSPYSLSFLEAHGTGTQVGDPEEISAIDEVFTKERTTPLLIGSVKSNMGHSEASAGICSVSKMIVAMETGFIPPNINFNKPKDSMFAIKQGRLKVVTEKTPLSNNSGLIGINSFGFGGGNCHVLVRWNVKEKINHGIPNDDLPRLVCVSGRTEDGVLSILDDLASRQLDAEYVTLLHQLFSKDFPNYFYRGYSIITKTNEIKRSWSFTTTKYNLYLIFCNLEGNSLKSFGTVLSKFGLFDTSFSKINTVLTKKFSTNAQTILNNTNDNFFKLFCYHISLIDFIKILGIEPNGIFGQPFGSLLNAYFHGTLNFEQSVLFAYEIDLFLKQAKYTAKNELRKNQRTINTPLKIMEIFNKTKPKLMEKLREIFGERKEDCLTNSDTKQISIEDLEDLVETINKFHTILSFEDYNIPDDSVVLCIGNIQLPSSNQLNIKIINFDHNIDNDIKFLEIIGRLYELGFNSQIHKLYPVFEYPVSRSTPMISPLIRWNHKNSCFLSTFKTHETKNISARSFLITLLDNKFAYMSGHVIDGRNLFPAIGYLELVWKTLAQSLEIKRTEIQVVFENCKFSRATSIPKEGLIELTVMIQKVSGHFEIIESNTTIVTGRIFVPKNIKKYQTNSHLHNSENFNDVLSLTKKDIYKELRLRGYNYKGAFRNLIECNNSASIGKIEWENNWVTFIDAMMQMRILQIDSRLLYIPTFIQRLTIDAKKHLKLSVMGGKPVFNVEIQKYSHVINCGGIEILGIKANSIGRRRSLGEPVLEKCIFIPNKANLNLFESLRVMVQIILENALEIRVKTIELIDESAKEHLELLSPIIYEILGDLPLIQANMTIFSKAPIEMKQIKVEDKKLAEETDCLLVIGSKILLRPMVLQQAFGALGKNGFILSREDLNFSINEIDEIDIFLIHTTHKEKLVLFRKSANNIITEPTIIDVGDIKTFKWLPQLQKSVKNNEHIVVYTQNKLISGILGLVNCIRREPNGSNVKCVFIIDEAPKFDFNHIFYSNQLKKNAAFNVYKNSTWGTYRHLLLENLEQIESEHCYVNVTERGDLSSLKWLQGPLSTITTHILPENTLVNVYYSALNFRDVMTASGRINADAITLNRLDQNCILGFEFSGRDLIGQRVMGIINKGALASLVLADNYLLWPVPNHWTLEDAATVPVVYATVLYALVVRGRIKRGQSILIHSGSGGVGQAAINIALQYDCRIFTTVGTQEKREFLRKCFPQIREKHIGNSRDTSFEIMIERETLGQGVDLVLNSLAEEKLFASVRCLASGGTFLEIGKFDLINNNSLRLLLANKEITFHGIMLDQIFNEIPSVKKHLLKIFTKCIENRCIRPLVRTIYKENEVEQAIRYMASGKQFGKVLINIRKEEKEKLIIPTKKQIRTVPRYSCDSQKSYIITGGLGGIGLELADWLILRGARNIVLTSRNGIKTGYQALRLNIWRSYGVTIHVSTINNINEETFTELIKESENLAPVDAIFNLAVILRDNLLENQTIESFCTVFEPKAYGVKYLDKVSRKLCSSLRNFIVFSSVSCGRGNVGQANYGMANSIMENICEKRKADGYPALAIQWGAIGEVGLVAEMQEEQTELEIGGTLQQRISNCLDVLDKFFFQNNLVVSSMIVAEKRTGSGGADNVVDAVANILGIRDLKTISLHSTLVELGMDSMTAVEIKQTLEREFEVYVTPQDIRNMTFARLCEIQAEIELEPGSDRNKKQRILEGIEMLVTGMPDETTCYLPFRKLPTNIDNTAEAPTVYIFPGLDGVQNLLESLTKNLNCHAIGLQFPYNNPEDTIEEMTKNVFRNLQGLFKERITTFNFVCYSYGTNIALEVISKLEESNYEGNLLIIDGSPGMLKTFATKYLQNHSEAFFETELLCQLLSTYVPINMIWKNKDSLIKCKNFDERMDLAKNLIPKDTPYSKNFQKQVAIALRKRIKALVNYEPTYKKIRSKIKIFKPQFTSLKDLPQDYWLSEISTEPIQIKTVYGNHVTILENLELANEINRMMGVEVISEEISSEELKQENF